MKPFALAASWLLASIIFSGCASTTVTDRDEYTGGLLPRPDQIIVYDFSANPADVPPESALAGLYSNYAPPQTAEQVATSSELGMEIARELVAAIQAMGLPAVQNSAGVVPQEGDLVIKGYFVSIEQGSAGKRMLIGFGSGNAELKTMVEGYLVTPEGLRRLGSGEVNASGNKTPGMLLGAATFAATDNPAGLIISGVTKVAGQETGDSTIQGDAKRTAKEIADQLKVKFEEQGWI
jgi:hypothetical protein